MANKRLTASVKLNTTQFESKLKRMARSVDALNNAVKKQHRAYYAVNAALNKNVKSTDNFKRKTNEVANSANKVHANFKKSGGVIDSLARKLKGLAATYLGVMGTKAVIGASDTVTRAQNQLNGINGNNHKQTAETMDKVYAAAQRSRGSYSGMLTNVSKSMMLAGDSFGGNVDNAIRFQEIMSKAYTIGGASAAEQSSSMYQMIQALGAGTLAGDELRSVREGAPLAYKAIEKFAQKVYNTSDSLKDMASDGMITSEIVVAGIMDAGDEMEEKFKNTAMTFEQAWNTIKNTAMKAFQSVLENLNKILNSDVGKAIIEGISNALLILANAISWVFSVLGAFFNWCSDNWSWLSRTILTVLTIIGVSMAVILFPKFIAWIQYIAFVIQYYAVIGAQALAAGIKAMIGWMMANWALLLIIVVIAAVIIAVIWLSDSFADACGMIVGGIMAAIAFIWNLIVGVINGIIQLLWTQFVEPLLGIIEWILNVCNGGFDSFGDAVKNLLGNIISWFLSLGKVVTKIIDAIFGTNWTDGLNKLQDNVLKWGKNDQAITISREAPSLKDVGVDRWAYGDAYDTGYKWGKDGGDWITDKVSSFGNLLTGGGLPDPYDPAYALDPYDTSNTLHGIEDNTDAMKDGMDLADDDLKLLRQIAEQEWRNEFTTAEIKVDMTNYNTVEGDRDLDGIVEYLSTSLRDEMSNVAYGVHY